jgi:hypothetical protein
MGKGQGGSGGGANPRDGFDGAPAGPPGGGGAQANAPPQDSAGTAGNADDKAKNTELVLKKLEDQLKNKKVDPEVLKKLGWTEEDAKRFVDRVRTAQENKEKPSDPLSAKDRETIGGGVRSRSGRGAGSTVQDDKRDLLQDRRIAPPREYKDRYEAYNRSLSLYGSGQKPAARPAAAPATGDGKPATPAGDAGPAADSKPAAPKAN